MKYLGCIGLSEKVISWFESHLSGRTFKVNINKKFLDPGFQHENMNEIEDQLNLNFSSLCDGFIDNKLSIHLGEDKTKLIFFLTKFDIEYN